MGVGNDHVRLFPPLTLLYSHRVLHKKQQHDYGKVEQIKEAVAGAEALCICEDLVAVRFAIQLWFR